MHNSGYCVSYLYFQEFFYIVYGISSVVYRLQCLYSEFGYMHGVDY